MAARVFERLADVYSPSLLGEPHYSLILTCSRNDC